MTNNYLYSGLAYVEFEDEVSAKVAVQKADGADFGDSKLSVAFSQPPPRADKPASGKLDFESTSLGSAPKTRKTQVSFVPTTVRRNPSMLPPAAPAQPAKSNADFRAMLLKK